MHIADICWQFLQSPISVDQHCGMAANANVLGNSSKSIRDPGCFIFVVVVSKASPFSWVSRVGRRVGKLWITPSSSSSEVSHLISTFFFNMILVKCRREKEKKEEVFTFLIHWFRNLMSYISSSEVLIASFISAFTLTVLKQGE